MVGRDTQIFLPLQVIRSGQKMEGKKALGQKQGGGGFFSSLFGRKAKKEEQEIEESKGTDGECVAQFGSELVKSSFIIVFSIALIYFRSSGSGLDELMTAEEKEKLYTAIGYSGSSHNLTLPKQVGAHEGPQFECC